MGEPRSNSPDMEHAIYAKLDAIDKGVRAMTDRVGELAAQIDNMEERLSSQEHRSRKAERRQEMQEADIERLKEIVGRIAEEQGWDYHGGRAVRKEPVYEEIERAKYDRNAAMKSLRNAGVIREDCQGKTTCVVSIKGKPTRVVIVI